MDAALLDALDEVVDQPFAPAQRFMKERRLDPVREVQDALDVVPRRGPGALDCVPDVLDRRDRGIPGVRDPVLDRVPRLLQVGLCGAPDFGPRGRDAAPDAADQRRNDVPVTNDVTMFQSAVAVFLMPTHAPCSSVPMPPQKLSQSWRIVPHTPPKKPPMPLHTALASLTIVVHALCSSVPSPVQKPFQPVEMAPHTLLKKALIPPHTVCASVVISVH